MGGATFRVAQTTVDNQGFVAGTNVEATTVSMGLAF
jgi:hypothetical protein